jgi:hypothetical protein
MMKAAREATDPKRQCSSIPPTCLVDSHPPGDPPWEGVFGMYPVKYSQRC